MTSTVEQEAYLLKYMELGLSLIPLRGKTPLVQWKEFKLTDDNRQYWINRGVNWGIRTGLLPSGDHFYVIDLDDKKLLSSFYESNPNLIWAPLVSTARGFHIYLTWKSPARARHFSGMDIIYGGYVVCPPSIHPSGHVYKFIIPLKGLPPTFNPEWLELPTEVVGVFPPSLSDVGHITPTTDKGVPGVPQTTPGHMPPGVPQGQRHNSLVHLLGILSATHFTEEEALTRVIEWNKLNHPPLSEHEVITTVNSCYQEWERKWRENIKRGKYD